MALQPKGFILSGGPASVYEANAPSLPVMCSSGMPILGICYGMQLIAHNLGGRVSAGHDREYGDTEVRILRPMAAACWQAATGLDVARRPH